MTVGVLGGGQLGRMLALAGIPLGLDFVFLDPSPSAPARAVGRHIVAAYDDEAALADLAAAASVVTYEFENVPGRVAERLAATHPVWPPPTALAVAQDRLEEKRLFERLGIPTASHVAVASGEEARAAAERMPGPALLKTRRLGYDGKGQARVEGPGDAADAFAALGGRACLIETLVPFSREVSVIAARSPAGEVAVYPLAENLHVGGILRRARAPAAAGGAVDPARRAEAYARAILQDLGYIGVLAVEFFEVEGDLFANELAPRVHNSGHWTIEGAETSQFENHVRAVAGLPLGAATARGHSLMLNVIGTSPDAARVLAVPGAHLHLYGKAERPGRKLGHVTVRSDDPGALEDAERRLAFLLPPREEEAR